MTDKFNMNEKFLRQEIKDIKSDLARIKFYLRISVLILLLVIGYFTFDEYNSSPQEYEYECGTIYVDENSITTFLSIQNSVAKYYVLNSITINEVKTAFRDVDYCSEVITLLQKWNNQNKINPVNISRN
jgi:hypothetical protein